MGRFRVLSPISLGFRHRLCGMCYGVNFINVSGFGIFISKGRVCVRMIAFVDNISLRDDSSAIIHTYNLIKRISDFF